MNDAVGQLSARAAGMVEIRRPSFGNFYLTGQIHWFYGFAQRMSFAGLTMDAGFISSIVSDQHNKISDIVAYNTAQSARYSAYEHLIPEQMFSTDPNNPVEGVSAVKALGRAAEQGQKIWSITRNNLELALSRIQVGNSIKDDIRQAVNAGRTATVSEREVTIGGWHGVGYVLQDTQTGGAAYKISGGANGGALFNVFLSIFGISAVALMGFIVGAPAIAILWLASVMFATVIFSLIMCVAIFQIDDLRWNDVKGNVGFVAGQIAAVLTPWICLEPLRVVAAREIAAAFIGLIVTIGFAL